MDNLVILNEPWNWNLDFYDFTLSNIPRDYKEFFLTDEIQTEIKLISNKIKKEIEEGNKIFPEINNVYRTFQLPPEKIKVIILGQDPYHNEGSATGLAFSVPSTLSPINPSLKNIYTELDSEGFLKERTGSLVNWFNQGVMLLNTALTVNKNDAGSHTHFWRNFSKLFISYISNNTKNIAFLLMGQKAIFFSKFINKNNNHKLFLTSHPSPFSARKEFFDKEIQQKVPSFIGSNIFLKINEFLKEENHTSIDW
jgi:uracil-DNA glycosylase